VGELAVAETAAGVAELESELPKVRTVKREVVEAIARMCSRARGTALSFTPSDVLEEMDLEYTPRKAHRVRRQLDRLAELGLIEVWKARRRGTMKRSVYLVTKRSPLWPKG